MNRKPKNEAVFRCTVNDLKGRLVAVVANISMKNMPKKPLDPIILSKFHQKVYQIKILDLQFQTMLRIMSNRQYIQIADGREEILCIQKKIKEVQVQSKRERLRKP